jgi:hypothetical protein
MQPTCRTVWARQSQSRRSRPQGMMSSPAMWSVPTGASLDRWRPCSTPLGAAASPDLSSRRLSQTKAMRPEVIRGTEFVGRRAASTPEPRRLAGQELSDRAIRSGLLARACLLPMLHPTWIESAVTQVAFARHESARALVLIPHPDEASRQHPGHDFVADVVHANGLAVLPFSLPASGDDETGGTAHSLSQARLRLRSALAWLVPQPAMRGRPVALIGVDGAVPRDCPACDNAPYRWRPH